MQAEEVSRLHSPRTNWPVVFVVLGALVLALLPVLFRWPAPPSRGAGVIFVYLPAVLVAVACFFFDRTCTRREESEAIFLCLVFAFLSTYLQNWLVDEGEYFGVPNLRWQMFIQNSVINLRPESLPHSYRFLPNSLVRLFEQVTGDFAVARDAYRNLFGVLFYYASYRFARIFLRHSGGLFCLALWMVVFPVSLSYQAGQLTDAMSHLSFVLAFMFIETNEFVYLLMTIVIGCLAKETIAIMAGYYALFPRAPRRPWPKIALLIAAPIIVCLLARGWVLHGPLTYDQVSGVSAAHVTQNWNDFSRWVPGLVFTIGIFVPILAVGWRTTPWGLRSLALYLFPLLFASSLFFSWLREVRNFMPLVPIISILTVYYLAPRERALSSDQPPAFPPVSP